MLSLRPLAVACLCEFLVEVAVAHKFWHADSKAMKYSLAIAHGVCLAVPYGLKI